MKTRGAIVAIVGPDGSGKSTLAAALALRTGAEHRYVRIGPLPWPGRLTGKPLGKEITSAPQARRRDGTVKAVLRLLYYWVDAWIGWARVRSTGEAVVVERGHLDLAVDPRRYGFADGPLFRTFIGFFPRFDLLIVLDCASESVSRKQELLIEEAERQTVTWKALRRGFHDRLVVDGEQPPAELLRQAAARFRQLTD